MMLTQSFIDGMNSVLQSERSKSQMTLGGLVKFLKENPDAKVKNINSPDSYRGYYCDLAFSETGEYITASELIDMVSGCIGKEFEGYKGGEYIMTESTPIWIASYGSCGLKLIGFDDKGNLITEEDD